MGSEPPALYRILAVSPPLLRAWTDLSWPLRSTPHADRGMRELLIMRTAQLSGCSYEWAHHWGLALKNGVAAAKLEALDRWCDSALFSPAECAALTVNDEICKGDVKDSSFAALEKYFSEEAIVQLMMTTCFYICVAKLVSAAALQPECEYEDVPFLEKYS